MKIFEFCANMHGIWTQTQYFGMKRVFLSEINFYLHKVLECKSNEVFTMFIYSTIVLESCNFILLTIER